MKINWIPRTGLMLVLAGIALLSGCASQPKTLYAWDGYQPQVYKYLKGESPDQQVVEMEKVLQTLGAQGVALPPGFHAHLGMLYSITGKQDQMVTQFEVEKKLFPESAAYMDFLLAKGKKGEKL